MSSGFHRADSIERIPSNRLRYAKVVVAVVAIVSFVSVTAVFNHHSCLGRQSCRDRRGHQSHSDSIKQISLNRFHYAVAVLAVTAVVGVVAIVSTIAVGAVVIVMAIKTLS